MPTTNTSARAPFLGFGPYPNLPLQEMDTAHIVHVLENNRLLLCETQYKELVEILMKRIGFSHPIHWIDHAQESQS